MLQEDEKSGLYQRAIYRISQWAKPMTQAISERFIRTSVAHYAPDNPEYARIIEFEVRRRAVGIGLSHDIADPLIWTGIKTVAALGIAVLTESIKNKKVKLVGYASSLGLLLNNGVELLHLIPRYKAGLMGSLEMAKDRWSQIQTNGMDPFSQQIHSQPAAPEEKGSIAERLNIRPREATASTSFKEQATRAQSPAQLGL